MVTEQDRAIACEPTIQIPEITTIQLLPEITKTIHGQANRLQHERILNLHVITRNQPEVILSHQEVIQNHLEVILNHQEVILNQVDLAVADTVVAVAEDLLAVADDDNTQ